MAYEITEFLDKVDGFHRLSQREQVKLMAFFYCLTNNTDSFTPSRIKPLFAEENLKPPANLSREINALSSSKDAILLRKGEGYVFERNARKNLEELYLGSTPKQVVSIALRDYLNKIDQPEQKVFLEEAIRCFEVKSYRATVLMVWLLAIDTLYEHIIANHLIDFNAAIQAHGKYRKLSIAKKDHFTDIKESDFIELMRVGKIITNDRRKILEEKLDFRNTCAHPNTIVIRESKAVAFVEDLIENIITQFC